METKKRIYNCEWTFIANNNGNVFSGEAKTNEPCIRLHHFFTHKNFNSEKEVIDCLTKEIEDSLQTLLYLHPYTKDGRIQPVGSECLHCKRIIEACDAYGGFS